MEFSPEFLVHLCILVEVNGLELNYLIDYYFSCKSAPKNLKMLAKTFFDLVFLLTICTENPIKHQASELTKGLFNFAESGQFPFLVKLRPGNDTYYNFECDGALISPEYIVTAASCLDE